MQQLIEADLSILKAIIYPRLLHNKSFVGIGVVDKELSQT